MNRPKLAALVAAGAALLTVTGCAEQPGAAATIGDTTVSRSDVDRLAQVQCDLARGQNAPQPRARTVQATVNVLVESAIDNGYGEEVGADFDNAALQAQVQQFRGQVASLSASDRAFIVDAYRDAVRGQLMLKSIGEERLKAEGATKPTADEAVNRGTKLARAWADEQGLHVDPRYNPGSSGQAGGADGSISKKVSAYARGAARQTPTQAFVSGLPANLSCG